MTLRDPTCGAQTMPSKARFCNRYPSNSCAFCLRPWLSLFAVALEWLAIGGAVGVLRGYWNPALYVLTVMWVGARQHALAVLMHKAPILHSPEPTGE